MRTLTLALAILTVLGCGAMPSTGRSGPGFVLNGPKWTLEKEETSFTYTGEGTVTTTDTAGMYFVLLQAIREKRLDPSRKPDTVFSGALVIRGTGTFDLREYESRCTDYYKRNCIREASTPEVKVSLLAWLRYEAISQ